MNDLPGGPRGLLFRQLLPNVQPLLDELQRVAAGRRKTMSQVALNWCMCKGTIPVRCKLDPAQGECLCLRGVIRVGMIAASDPTKQLR